MWHRNLLGCALLLWGIAPGGTAQNATRVALVDNATVRVPRTRLCDLFPQNAPENLRRMAALVDLGRTPLPGSARIFTADELRRALRDRMQVEIPKQVVVHGGGWPLLEDSIRTALSSRAELHPVISDAKLIVPPELTSRSPNPALQLFDLRPGANRQEEVAFLRCRQRSDCGSFMVRVLFDRPLAEPLAGNAAGRKPRLVQPGRPALLTVEQAGLTITMRVSPLRAAGLGETVRAIEKKLHRIFVAQVVAEDRLETRFGEDR